MLNKDVNESLTNKKQGHRMAANHKKDIESTALGCSASFQLHCSFKNENEIVLLVDQAIHVVRLNGPEAD